jgi:hypothetical protein
MKKGASCEVPFLFASLSPENCATCAQPTLGNMRSSISIAVHNTLGNAVNFKKISIGQIIGDSRNYSVISNLFPVQSRPFGVYKADISVCLVPPSIE